LGLILIFPSRVSDEIQCFVFTKLYFQYKKACIEWKNGYHPQEYIPYFNHIQGGAIMNGSRFYGFTDFGKRLSMALLICALPASRVWASDAAKPIQNLVELSSAKSMTYKMPVGPWVNANTANTLTATPLDVRTGEAPCRVRMEACGYMQVLPASEMKIDVSGSSVKVTLVKGGFMYGLYEGVLLKAISADGVATAEAGSVQNTQTQKNAKFVSMGIIQMVSASHGAIEISNIKGQARVATPTGKSIDLASGQKYRSANEDVALVNSKDDLNGEVAIVNALPKAVAAPNSMAADNSTAMTSTVIPPDKFAGLLMTIIMPGLRDDDLSAIVKPHLASSPWDPPVKYRGPIFMD